MSETLLSPLRIAAITDLADGIRGFELVHPAGAELPPFTAGAHVRVQVPGLAAGDLRKYSLCNSPAERQRYCIAVKREAASRGGSAALCDHAQVGDLLPVSAPDNAFPLRPSPVGYVFIAGGIGITPIMAMIRSLTVARGDAPLPWKLVYLTRSPETTAFADELAAPALQRHVRIHHDHGDPARAFDLWPLLEHAGAQHLYCCGPRPLMDAVQKMSGHWTPGHVHFESFVEGGGAHEGDHAFTVKLQRSGRTLQVPANQSILDALLAAGVEAPSSCASGTCGTCRTTLLHGQADHRDMVLMDDEQARQIMVCVSRAHSAELVLDL